MAYSTPDEPFTLMLEQVRAFAIHTGFTASAFSHSLAFHVKVARKLCSRGGAGERDTRPFSSIFMTFATRGLSVALGSPYETSSTAVEYAETETRCLSTLSNETVGVWMYLVTVVRVSIIRDAYGMCDAWIKIY